MASRSGLNTIGLALLASVCVTPHRALGNERYCWIPVMIGNNVRNKYFGGALQSFLHYVYTKYLGFPKTSKIEEVAFVSERVARLDFQKCATTIKHMSVPIFFSYAEDDHLLQKERFEEMVSISPTNENNMILKFTKGLNN